MSLMAKLNLPTGTAFHLEVVQSRSAALLGSKCNLDKVLDPNRTNENEYLLFLRARWGSLPNILAAGKGLHLPGWLGSWPGQIGTGLEMGSLFPPRALPNQKHGGTK